MAAELSRLDSTSMLRWAKSHGYELTSEEAAGLSESYHQLSDDDLEQVAGGWSAGSNEPCGP